MRLAQDAGTGAGSPPTPVVRGTPKPTGRGIPKPSGRRIPKPSGRRIPKPSARRPGPERQDRKEGRRRPVVLVHGILGQRHLYWNLFRSRLEEDGYEVHEAVLPYYLLGDLDEAARHLVIQLKHLLDESRARRLDLVCHSAGGLAGRRAMQSLGDRIGHLVMMGTPNQGTHVGRLVSAVPFLGIGRATKPQSAFLASLDLVPPDPQRVHCLWSPVDGIVIPGRNAALPGADNIELPWTGHWMFLWSRAVYDTVHGILQRPLPGRRGSEDAPGPWPVG